MFKPKTQVQVDKIHIWPVIFMKSQNWAYQLHQDVEVWAVHARLGLSITRNEAQWRATHRHHLDLSRWPPLLPHLNNHYQHM